MPRCEGRPASERWRLRLACRPTVPLVAVLMEVCTSMALWPTTFMSRLPAPGAAMTTWMVRTWTLLGSTPAARAMALT